MQSIAYPNTFQDESPAQNSAIDFKQVEFTIVAVGVFIAGIILLLGARVYAIGFLMVWLFIFSIVNSMRSPESSLYILAFLLPYEQLIFRYGLGRYNTLSYLALAILFLWVIVFKLPRFFRRIGFEECCLIAFMVWLFTSALWVGTFSTSFGPLVTWGGGVAVFLLFRRGLVDMLTLKRVIWFYIMGAIVLGTFSLLDYDTTEYVQRGAEDQFDWVPSTLGWALGITSVLLARATSVGVIGAIFLWENETERKRKLIALISALVLGIYTILTGNRSANYSLLIALLLWIIFGQKFSTRIKKIVIAVILLSVVIVAGLAINKGALETRLVDTSMRSSEDYSSDEAEANAILSGRYGIWETGLKFFEDNPWLGIGLGQFPYEYERTTGEVRGAHNTYLELLIETGVVGFSLFVFYLLVLLIKAMQCGQWRAASISWFFGFVLTIGAQSLDRGKEYWLVMGLICAMMEFKRTNADLDDNVISMYS